jgi:hypothetical protein
MNTININDMRRLAGLSEISVKKDLTRVSESGRRGLPNDSHPVNRRNLKEQDMNNDTSNRIYYDFNRNNPCETLRLSLTRLNGGYINHYINVKQPYSVGDTVYAVIDQYIADEPEGDYSYEVFTELKGIFGTPEEAKNCRRNRCEDGKVCKVQIEEGDNHQSDLSEAEEGGENNIFTVRFKLTDDQLEELSRRLRVSGSIIIRQSKSEGFFNPIGISPETLDEIINEYRPGS